MSYYFYICKHEQSAKDNEVRREVLIAVLLIILDWALVFVKNTIALLMLCYFVSGPEGDFGIIIAVSIVYGGIVGTIWETKALEIGRMPYTSQEQ